MLWRALRNKNIKAGDDCLLDVILNAVSSALFHIQCESTACTIVSEILETHITANHPQPHIPQTSTRTSYITYGCTNGCKCSDARKENKGSQSHLSAGWVVACLNGSGCAYSPRVVCCSWRVVGRERVSQICAEPLFLVGIDPSAFFSPSALAQAHCCRVSTDGNSSTILGRL
eukprot:scaffold2060_cov161-Alexandrium_tamarense.AAC.6